MQPVLSKGETRAKQGSCCQEVNLGKGEGFSLSAAFIPRISAGLLTKSKARPRVHTINLLIPEREIWKLWTANYGETQVDLGKVKLLPIQGFLQAGRQRRDCCTWAGRLQHWEFAATTALSSCWILWPDYIQAWVVCTDPAGSELDLFPYYFILDITWHLANFV